MHYVTTIERIARQEGKQEGAILLLVRLLAHRFGEIPEAIREQLQTLSLEQLTALMDSAMTAASLHDFVDHLPEPTATPMNGA